MKAEGRAAWGAWQGDWWEFCLRAIVQERLDKGISSCHHMTLKRMEQTTCAHGCGATYRQTLGQTVGQYLAHIWPVSVRLC